VDDTQASIALASLQEDIKKLSYITKREHMRGSELMENFRTSQFTVRMSRDTYTQLRQQKKFMSGTYVVSLDMCEHSVGISRHSVGI
jgi:hypothetical protein